MSNKEKAELQDLLRINTKRGNWKKVVAMYEEASDVAHNLKLNQYGDTALHLAVVDNQEEIVEKLVELISFRSYKELLEISNDEGNTPLHLAAELGSARMCHVITSAHEKLVHMRNKTSQTPLFLAAMYGHKNVFYCLYYFCRSDQATTNCRQNNGDTVLHLAIENEQYDFAFQLIHMIEGAKHWVNEKGLTPLHVLASKPTSFKSGAHIRGWQNIVYYSTFVDQLKPQSIEILSTAWNKTVSKTNTTSSYFPDNYKTCIDFFTRLRDGFVKVSSLESLFNKKDDEAKKHNDLEKHVNMESEIDQRANIGLLKADQSGRDQSTDTNFPRNYTVCIKFFKIVFSTIMIILGFGFWKIRKIQEKKQKHSWAIQVMEELLDHALTDKYEDDGYIPMESTSKTYDDQSETSPYDIVGDEAQFSNEYLISTTPKDSDKPKYVKESAMLLAAKNGVIEMVMELFKKSQPAIRDSRSSDKKNIVHLATAYRQPDVYRFLLEKKKLIENLFRAVDNNGDSALHLAAAATDPKLWRITGAALQMQWEVKWYKFVKESMPLHVFQRRNKKGKSASKIFHETHMSQVTKGGEWLYNTSESCSVVATLIATVAFTSTVAIPGGNNEGNGAAILEKEEGFFIFAISSLIALCLSSTSVLMFLAILTSRFEAEEFGSNLPWKLLIGMSSLYFSIIATLISFCAGHYFLIVDRLQNIAILLYTLTFLPVALIFGIAQLPLYFDLLRATLKKVPNRSADVILSNDPSDEILV